MQKVSLIASGRHHLEHAERATSGRSAATVFGGHEHRLRQTLIALRAGQSLSEHENPGEATVQVLSGRVLLRSGATSWNGSPGDLLTVPPGLHAVDAIEDSVILLTTVVAPASPAT
jgi:quercetin dioxygenase-like cupin family protein